MYKLMQNDEEKWNQKKKKSRQSHADKVNFSQDFKPNKILRIEKKAKKFFYCMNFEFQYDFVNLQNFRLKKQKIVFLYRRKMFSLLIRKLKLK